MQPIFYCEYSSKLDMWEAEQKGYKNDIYIYYNEEFFKISVYEIVRLQQDFHYEVNRQGYYSIDANLVLVPEVTPNCIKKTVLNLIDQNFFDSLKSVIPQKSKLTIF